jgi:UDP-N-acetylglucosamine--dolichyl-phosphate N-acetylglucosaminephosphotransferase
VLELYIIPIIAFIITLVSTRYLIIILKNKGLEVIDYFKEGKPKVPRPGGPAIILGIAIAELILYIITSNNKVLALLLSSIIAFIVGYIDDRRVMGGYYKPLGLLAAALPIILLNAYDYNLEFPLVGSVRIPILYIPLIFIFVSIFGNTINSIDVFNGLASAFIVIATIPLIIALILANNYELLAAALALLAAALAFYLYHRYPSKIFPGDSGVITLGVAYAALAIIAELEIIAVIALLPAIINSFFFLSTVKKIVEHRELKDKPTILLDDYRIAANKNANAPITLVRLIVAKEPLYEYQIVRRILALAAFSASLAIITIFMM